MRTEKTGALPEVMRFADGRPVETAEQWAARRKEILALYETYVYGKMPDSALEEVSYVITPGRDAQERDMKITVRREGREASFTVG